MGARGHRRPRPPHHVEALDALGIVESFPVASLIEVRLAMALGGKAFVTLTGDVAAVESAVAAAAGTAERDDLIRCSVRTP